MQVETYTQGAYDFVGWNTRRVTLADRRVRRALTLGTNRAEIVEALLAGYGQVANSSVPPYHWAHDASLLLERNAHDPVKARRLLDEAGWIDRDGDGIRENADGGPLSLEVKFNQGNQTRQDVAGVMQAQLSQIGVEIQPTAVEGNTLLEQVTSERRDFDGVIIGWTTGYRLDDTDLLRSDRQTGPYGFTGIQSPELDVYLDTLQTIMDREEAIPVWRDYQELLNEVHPHTFLYYPRGLVAYHNRVNRIDINVTGRWAGIRDWWIEPSERRQR